MLQAADQAGAQLSDADLRSPGPPQWKQLASVQGQRAQQPWFHLWAVAPLPYIIDQVLARPTSKPCLACRVLLHICLPSAPPHLSGVCSCTSALCAPAHLSLVCSCTSVLCAPAHLAIAPLLPTPSPGATTLTWCQHPHLVPTPSPGATRELPPPSPGANTLTWCHKSCQHPHLVPTPSPGATRVVASVSQPYSHILMPYCCNCSSFRLPEGGGQLLAEGLRAFGHHFFLCGVCQQHFSQVRGGVLHDARQGQMDIMCLGLRVA